MEVYIGLDVHARSTTAVVLGMSGKRLRQAVIETSREAMVELLESVEGNRHVCFEEGTASEWIYEVVKPLTVEAVCCQPTRRSHSSKNDLRDAERLANDLRRGAIETLVYKGAGAMVSLRTAVRCHRLLNQDVARVKNRMKAIFRSRGIVCEGTAIYDPMKREAWMTQLPAPYRELVTTMAAELDALVPLREHAEKRLLEESAPHDAIDRLATIPGIGPIRAAYIAAIVVTPHRFRSKRQFWSYCGLAVISESSGDWKRIRGQWIRTSSTKTRGLNTKRNPWLKEIFKAAALSASTLREDHPLRIDYDQMLLRGMRPNLARLTLARRLAATALALWKKQEVYDYSKRHRPPTPKAA